MMKPYSGTRLQYFETEDTIAIVTYENDVLYSYSTCFL